MRNVGLDLATKKIACCEVADGAVVHRRTVTSLHSLEELLGPNTPKARVAIEACREAWHVHDELTARGHEVLIVDTTRVRKLGIGDHGRKTDKIDAEVLARAVESGHIPRAHVLSPERRELRLQLSVRRALVETRTQYMTTIRGLLRAKGARLSTGTPETFVARLRKSKVDEDLRALCSPLVEILIKLDGELATVERKVTALAERDPIHSLLMSAPGVGFVVAAVFVSVVDDAKRFAKAHGLQSYLGLVPAENSSGGKRRLGAITKNGNSYARTTLVQAAWSILRTVPESDPLKRWAVEVEKRRGKRVAVIALARRLAGVLWAMWRDGTFYDSAAVGVATPTEQQSSEQKALAIARVTKKAKQFELRGARARKRQLRGEAMAMNS